MARTALAIQEIARGSGAALTAATPDAANGNYFPNDGITELVIDNGDAASKTVTVVSVPCEHGRTGDLAVTISAGAKAVLGPFPPSLFNQSDGTVQVNWSAATSVQVTAVRQR